MVAPSSFDAIRKKLLQPAAARPDPYVKAGLPNVLPPVGRATAATQSTPAPAATPTAARGPRQRGTLGDDLPPRSTAVDTADVQKRAAEFRAALAAQFGLAFPTLARRLVHWDEGAASDAVEYPVTCPNCGTVEVPGVTTRKRIGTRRAKKSAEPAVVVRVRCFACKYEHTAAPEVTQKTRIATGATALAPRQRSVIALQKSIATSTPAAARDEASLQAQRPPPQKKKKKTEHARVERRVPECPTESSSASALLEAFFKGDDS